MGSGSCKERFVATARNSVGEKGEQKEERNSLGYVASRSLDKCLWFRHVRPLAGRQKSEIAGKGVDRCRLHGRKTVERVRRKER